MKKPTENRFPWASLAGSHAGGHIRLQRRGGAALGGGAKYQGVGRFCGRGMMVPVFSMSAFPGNSTLIAGAAASFSLSLASSAAVCGCYLMVNSVLDSEHGHSKDHSSPMVG